MPKRISDKPKTPFQIWQFNNPLRSWRVRHNKTLQDVVGLLGLTTKATPCGWESGKCMPSTHHSIKLFRMVGCTYEEWQKWLSEKPPIDPKDNIKVDNIKVDNIKVENTEDDNGD